MADAPSLEVVELCAGYGIKTVLEHVDLAVAAGDVLLVIGANGSGKSTILRAVLGLCSIFRGLVKIRGTAIGQDFPVERRIQELSIGYLPQGQRVFAELSVHDHLTVTLGAVLGATQVSEGLEKSYHIFPELKVARLRAAGVLSGGERQMLGLAPLLVTRPQLLLLDEPTTGLAAGRAEELLVAITQNATAAGQAVVIVEHLTSLAMRYATRTIGLKSGRITFAVDAPVSLDDEAVTALIV